MLNRKVKKVKKMKEKRVRKLKGKIIREEKKRKKICGCQGKMLSGSEK